MTGKEKIREVDLLKGHRVAILQHDKKIVVLTIDGVRFADPEAIFKDIEKMFETAEAEEGIVTYDELEKLKKKWCE